MTLNLQDGWGIQALDQNQHSDRWQYVVKSGCAVSPGTNDLTVQCASGEVIHNGSSVSVSAQDNVSLQAADSSNPRKDTIYLDSNGSLTVATGTAEAAKPSGKVRENTYRPAPPDLSSTNAVVLAEVWVPAGASDITTSDVRDRRQLADLAAKSVTTGQITSRSLPIWRVYQDGSETVAIDETDAEIARDTDADTVWQAAFDAANDEFAPGEKYEPVAVIDGGGELYAIDNGLTVKDGAVLQNARFDASGLPSPSQALVFGGPDDGFTHGAVGGHNVLVRDAADIGVRFTDLAMGYFSDITVENPGANGVEVFSCIACSFDSVHSRNAGSSGFLLQDNGDTNVQVNANTFVNCRSHVASATGWTCANEQVQDNLFLGCLAESGGSHGVNEAGEGNQWIKLWLENNDGRGMLLQGDRNVVKSPKLQANNGGGGGTQGIRITSSTASVVEGPVTGNDEIGVAGTSTDTRLVRVPSDYVFSDSGTRTRRNGLGQEAASGTPTAADWEPGDLVEDTDNAGDVYLLLQDGSTWTQVAT